MTAETDASDEGASATEGAGAEAPPSSAPESFGITIRGWGADESQARALGERVGVYVRALSRYIDLSALDGVTVAGDYAQALAELDRGYSTEHVLKPSEGHVMGVAMTSSVFRDEQLKSHIVVHAEIMAGLLDEASDLHELALHTLAHECAHVAITAAFDSCFPSVLLKTVHDNPHQAYRWQIILACWDEYAATSISAPFGEDPTDGYQATLLGVLAETRERANACIRQYRVHGDVDRVLAEVYGAYGDLLKFAAYHLGNMTGRGLGLSDLPLTQQALEAHKFVPHWEELDAACRALAAKFGEWDDVALFEALGDLTDTVVREGGLYVMAMADGSVHVDIPFTAETLP